MPVPDIDRRCVDTYQHLIVTHRRSVDVPELQDLGRAIPPLNDCLHRALPGRRGVGAPRGFRLTLSAGSSLRASSSNEAYSLDAELVPNPWAKAPRRRG